MAVDIDLDFQRYIERRKGALEAQAREGAAYAYGGDLRVKKTLDSVRPVRLAIEASVRLWKSGAREGLLSGATKVTPEKQPRFDGLMERAAKALHIPRPALYLVPQLDEEIARTFGTDEDADVVLDSSRIETLSDDELLFVLARQCGHIQNHHVVLTTAQYHLTRSANRFLQWIVKPATLALVAWESRAALTCDRAGLIAVRNIDTACGALMKLGAAQYADAETPRRVEALRLFAESAYYKALVGETGGLTQAEVDGKVGEVLSR
jgi:Zn-dependent protease with chaperone function